MSGMVVVDEAPSPEQAEVVADAAVEVAAIEAETEVAIARIQAETEAAALAANAEVDVARNERADAWRREVDGLQAFYETTMAALSERVAEHEIWITNLRETVTLQAAALTALTPPPSSETPVTGKGEEAPPEAPDASAAPTESGSRKRRWM